MAFGLTIGTERYTTLQNSIQDELVRRGYSPEADPIMAEYITIMIINNKTAAQISSELEDDPNFVDWLFSEAAKGAPEPSDAPSSSTAAASAQPSTRDSPPHLPTVSKDEASRRPPSGPRASAPLYQQALSQALPSTSPTAQKRTASGRSPSPSGHGHVHKARRIDLPTGPRAMIHGRDVSSGSRSLLERVGPARNGGGGGGPQFGQDDIQARIDTITGAGGSPEMAMMMAGFPGMNGMGGMGMDMGMASMANPLLLQEMMMNQMALMSQMAGAMGIMPGQLMNGFPMQPGMGGDMFNGGMQGDGPGRGRGRGRGGPAGRGAGRGRGGHAGANGSAGSPMTDAGQASPPPPAAAPAVVAPTPTPVPIVAPVIASTSSSSSIASQQRTGFVPPQRPQSPTLCKFNLKCSNPLCRYSHPSPVATAESGVVLSNDPCEAGLQHTSAPLGSTLVPRLTQTSLPAAEHLKPSTFVPPPTPTTHLPTPCRYGAACTRPNCTFTHPPRASHGSGAAATPCRFGSACTRATCPFQHPEGRVLPGTFHRGLSTSAPLVSVKTPEAGSMSGLSHNRSVTFNTSKPSTNAAVLEKKVREVEEKKSEAEKAVAQAEKVAGSKDDASKPVAISA
ncbi:predicted protein [Postia placenta Mad-698-R]|uniref:C3H1-type domain-containing protein n=1 Tax=Postia placenta MAD-698-R-SB12 TaxID=670580 RepID=A0A1X6MZE7_9APHY|nr:hypothetical protein POSPLADRAFT_1046904 [Postia placenta MAD-698-R-SB12]EED85393.1 predicted protein [Postia placenta Mad-698-R]OSX61596.1 hypothetical protein POSPLADRAFT_1046904 [Postia placenta MAD-698-R-SB12]